MSLDYAPSKLRTSGPNPTHLRCVFFFILATAVPCACLAPEPSFHDAAVRFYGQADHLNNGTPHAVWSGGQEVLVVTYDVMIPGCYTKTTNNLRLLESKPKRRFDLNSFNAGDYEKAVDLSNSAAAITSVLYLSFVKELRLKQQYFWTAASLADILRRFKNIDKPITEFPDYVAIQLNDTHPTLAIPELVRILIDEEDQLWDTAWRIVTNTFYTNHTVLLEVLEKWPLPLLEHLLPHHLQILYDINMLFLHGGEEVPGRPRSAGMYEEEGLPKQVRMAFLTCIGSRKLQSDLVKTTIMKDFVEFEGITKFGNVTNGITPRRWLDQCDPELRALVFWTLKIDKAVWLKDLYQLEKLLPFAEDAAFRDKWAAIKQHNKERLVHHVQTTLGLTINTQAMFDVQIKRLHEYRQTLNILGVIYRYLTLKSMSRPAYYIVKLTIRLIVNIACIINADPDTKDLLSLYFLPDYSVSLAEVLIPASDISRHISTAGTEASGTSNMKFCLNGGLLLGTVDGANIEIVEEGLTFSCSLLWPFDAGRRGPPLPAHLPPDSHTSLPCGCGHRHRTGWAGGAGVAAPWEMLHIEDEQRRRRGDGWRVACTL
ncbi:carbohydrate phosphorylase-domain-containing protein [Mycena rebaudengoi]|nr:carbohydrate phosphorylase-domain-containing protein [Mycena rebaudengoi]